MKKIKTLIVLFLILGMNIIALSLKNIVAITQLFIVVCIVSIYFTSLFQTMGRIKIFIGIAFSLFIFQFIFVQAATLQVIFFQTINVAMKLFVVSETIRVGIQYISPISLISLFSFLPKNVQLLIAMTFYFIPLTGMEFQIIKYTQISRGLGNTMKSKLIAPIAFIIPLLHRIFQRSETITYSILSRGWIED